MANLITLARFPLLLVWVTLLIWGSAGARLFGAGLLLLGLLLDTVDGIVARQRGEASLLGSVLDIAADRAYELVVWVSFAALGVIPVAVPIIVIVRTSLTDALRSVGVAGGVAPLAQHRPGLSRVLVSSPWGRIGYSTAKIMAFMGLTLLEALPGAVPLRAPVAGIVWVAVALCVIRGLPVFVQAVPKRQPTR
jgi:phosphatidylglycerophosphate synthase